MPVPDQSQLPVAQDQIGDDPKRYTRAVYGLGDEAMKICFHADSTLRMGGYGMARQEFRFPVMDMLHELDVTHHQFGNIQTEFDSDVAHVETYFIAIHRIGAAGWSPYPQANSGDDLMLRGRCIDGFECSGGMWVIAHRNATSDWARFDAPGDRGLVANPPEPRGRRDRADSVHRHRSI